MPELSVIIPSRKEPYLVKTVESIRSAIRGDTEIIAVIDGEEAEPRMPADWPDDGGPPVRIVRNLQPLGQRQSCNIAARLSTAKFILKTDAHSMMDEGFDVKLMADCEYDWTVIPRMYNLHGWDLVCKGCGSRYYNRGEHRKCPSCGVTSWQTEVVWKPNWRKKTDWMWFRSFDCKDRPLRVQYWGNKDMVCDRCKARHDAVPDNGQCDTCGHQGFHKERESDAEYQAHRQWAKRQGDIADVMNGQGACWFLHRDRYWELGGMDEAHGSWGQMGVEVACKAWLSGGRHVVNRKTWFAHLFRCGDGASFPYEIHGSDQERARQYSIDLWSHNKWPGQKRPLSWLIDHFWPVPTWSKPPWPTSTNDIPVTKIGAESNDVEVLIKPADAADPPAKPALTVLYYTDGTLPPAFARAVYDQLRIAAGDLPIVEQIQPPDWPRNHESIYRNILAGLERVTTPFVALAEHDVLYPAGYFDHRPIHDIEYNDHRWCLHVDREPPVFSRRYGMSMSGCFAVTQRLKAAIEARLQIPAACAEHGKHFEPGRDDKGIGLAPLDVAVFGGPVPTIDITGHGRNLTGPKGIRGKPKNRVKPWGTASDLIDQFWIPTPTVTTTPKPDDGSVALDMDAFIEQLVIDDYLQRKGYTVEEWESNVLPNLIAQSRAVAEAPNHQSSIINHPSPKVSLLIPARNEVYLEATIKDLLKNLRLPFEILVGLDGGDQKRPVIDDPRVRFIVAEQRIGMRPMINKLAREARGEYLIRMDAHCMIAEGMDRDLVGVCEREGHVTVVAQRYELDAKRWKRRDKTDIPYRRLSHWSEDNCGLRSLPWPEFGKGREKIRIDETMSCSGSSWTCRRDTFVDWWGGFDERHGTFGQEGCEIACMTWLSGGRFLVNKDTWYAHWNRGKSTYSLGPHTKEKSIEHSKWLWIGNNWPHARYGFDWLLEHFNPPGWESERKVHHESLLRAVSAVEQRCLIKSRKRLRVDDLWNARDLIADPGKRHRLTIFWQSYDRFVRSVLAGAPGDFGSEEQYRNYLLSHVNRTPGRRPTKNDIRKVEKSIADSIRLIESVKKKGLLAPMEFYIEDGRMILWKGYRRLVIARAVGIKAVVGRCYGDRQAAGALSPQLNLTRLQNPPVDDLHRLAEDQYRQWGNGATDKYFTHNYTRLYDVHLHPIRKRAKKILELGLLNGASLALWRRYFPRAELFGVDIDPERWKKFASDLPRCTVLIGDESDPSFLRTVKARGPFDLIVDDASHDPDLQRVAFAALWPAVRQYGYYVIEDTFRSYDGGESTKPPCLPAGFESRLYTERDVLSIHHYYNIIFIQKA